MKLFGPALFLFFVLSGIQLHAQSTDLVDKVLTQLKLQRKDCDENLISVKKLPDSPDESIVVIPKLVVSEPDYFSLDSYILIVDSQTGKIRQKFYESQETNGWQSDAITLTSIWIDTAPYFVKEGTRAFGIRVAFTGSSSVNPYNYEMLSLFVREEEKLNRILKNYTTSELHGEWDGNCNGEFEKSNKLLLISKTKTNGYFDIQFKENTSITKNTLKGSDCVDKTTKKSSKGVLKFSKGSYR